MRFVNRDTGADSVNNCILCIKNKLIYLSLCIGKGAVDRKSSGYVSAVAFMLCTCINKNKRVIFYLTVVSCIVERGCVSATCDNSWESSCHSRRCYGRLHLQSPLIRTRTSQDALPPLLQYDRPL